MKSLAIPLLRLSHFRSHRLSQIETDGRPVAIFGPNGAGKTNILEAISLMSPGRGLRRATSDALIRRPDDLGWKVAASLQSGARSYNVETWAEPERTRQLRIDGKAAAQSTLGRIARILWLVPAMDRLWIEGAEGRRRFLDRMTLSFKPGHGEAVLRYEKAMRERNRLLKDQIADNAWYTALEAQMAEAGTMIRNNRMHAIGRLTAAQSESTSVFPVADLALTEAGSEADLATALAEGRRRDLQAGRTLVGPHRADIQGTYRAKGVDAAQCSTGEQKALLISLILANARALSEDTGQPPILLLDEVAAHLDPERRAALYDEICALGSQAWLTGTERTLFDALGGRAQYLAVEDHNAETRLSEK